MKKKLPALFLLFFFANCVVAFGKKDLMSYKIDRNKIAISGNGLLASFPKSKIPSAESKHLLSGLTPVYWYSNYVFRKKITINKSQVAGSADLVNFAVLLKINSPDLVSVAGRCTNQIQSATGNDIAFVDASSDQTTELPFEIDTYDNVAGTLLVWVKVPLLSSSGSSSAETTINMYYGSNNPSAHPPATSTWSSDYKAVYHFNEDSFNNAPSAVKESTGNANNGTTAGMTNANLTTNTGGFIGKCYKYTGNTSISSVRSIPITDSAFTISAWMYCTIANHDQKIITNQITNPTDGYKLAWYLTNNLEGQISNGTVPGGTNYYIRRDLNGPSLSINRWYFVQMVSSGVQGQNASYTTYLNGQVYKSALAPAPGPGGLFRIGVGEGGNLFYFNGLIDEVRVSTAAKSANWLLTEYNNQANPGATPVNGLAGFISSIGNIEWSAGNFAAGYAPGSVVYTWTGAASTDASNPLNWNNTTMGIANQVPYPIYSSLVITNVANKAQLTSNLSAYSLSMNASSSFNLNGQIFGVGCNIYNTSGGQILYNSNNSSGIIWNGSLVNQYYNGSANANTAQFGNFTINNTVGGTLTINGGYVDIYNTLNITKGNLVVSSSPAVLTLKSTPLLSASVSAIMSPYTITGNVNVERSFKAQANGTTADNTRNYRLLSSPVNMNGIIYNTAATSYFNLGFLNATSGGLTGVFTGGPGGTASGFTVDNATPFLYLYKENLTANPSTFNGGNFKGITNISGGSTVKVYNDAGNIANVDATLYSGTGYMLYYAGNNIANITSTTVLNKQYRVGGSYIAPDASTTTVIGTLNQGTIPVKLWWNNSTALSDVKNGYNLVGNPYASSIDWDRYNNGSSDIVGAGLSPTIYVYNYINRNYGTYQPGLPNGVGTGNGTHIIASGQGFFVKATSTSSNLTFNEGCKTNTQANNVNTGSIGHFLMGVKKNIAKPQLLLVKISKDSVNTDDIMILFGPDAKDGYEPDIDADRLSGISNIATLASYSTNSSKPLAINHMSSINFNTRVKLYVNVSDSKGVDTLAATGFSSLDPKYDVYLLDHFKRDSLLFSKYGRYLFNIDATDTASYGASRFELMFRKKASLAYKLLGFTGKPVTAGIQLTWTATNEQTFTSFELQRQSNTGEFVTIYALQSDGRGTYTYIDENPYAGSNIYRLKQVDAFGELSYSNLVTVAKTSNTAENDTFVLYPNPASSLVRITITANVPDRVMLRITNSAGRSVVYRESAGNNIEQNVNDLMSGMYIVQVIDKATQTLIGTKKMFKK